MIRFVTAKISNRFRIFDFFNALCRPSLLCPQKQCLSGKLTDIERSSSNSETPCNYLDVGASANIRKFAAHAQQTLPVRLRSAMNCARIRLFILRCRCAEHSTRRAKTKKTRAMRRSFRFGFSQQFRTLHNEKKTNSSFFVIISDGTTLCHFYNSPKTNSCTIK